LKTNNLNTYFAVKIGFFIRKTKKKIKNFFFFIFIAPRIFASSINQKYFFIIKKKRVMFKKSFLFPFLAVLAALLITFGSCKKCTDLPAPTVTVSNITSTAAKAAWNKIEGADGYQVVLANSNSTGDISTNEVTTTEFSFTGLTPSKGLIVKVTPRCKNGKLGTNTGTSSSFVTLPATTPCNLAAPVDLQINNVTSKSARATWSSVTGAVAYKVDLRDSLTGTLIRSIVVQGSPINLDSLNKGTRYKLTVTPDCGGGNFSPNSTTRGFVTPIIIDDVFMLTTYTDKNCSKPTKAISANLTYSTLYPFNSPGGNYYIRVYDNAAPTNFAEFRLTYGEIMGIMKCSYKTLDPKCYKGPLPRQPNLEQSIITQTLTISSIPYTIQMTIFSNGFIINLPTNPAIKAYWE
jgi:hypothetical protein